LPTVETPAPTAATFAHATPFPAGEPLAYTAQSGDTVQTLAIHFNTTVQEILAFNPDLPLTTTLNPGKSLHIPAYWAALSGPPNKIVPDSALVYGPSDVGFDAAAFLAAQPGFAKHASEFVAGQQRDAAATLMYVAQTYSISPRILLALMEWRSGALTNPAAPAVARDNPFGAIDGVTGYYAQLRYVAARLSEGYYGWRSGALTTLTLRDSTSARIDLFQNAGTAGVQALLAQWFDEPAFYAAAGPQGFSATYHALFGDPFQPPEIPVIPGNLTQPPLTLPFAPGQIWAFTGGPHPAWSNYTPWAAMDFAPAGLSGCAATDKWATAVAPGVVARSGDNTVILDLDGDGYEQTGWALFYFHLDNFEIIQAGTVVTTGDPLGHPSCEGGSATGSHVHLGRKYNGEWIPADGLLPGIAPFVLGGWEPARGVRPYEGRMTRIGQWVEACTCSTAKNTVYWVKDEGR
jgi:LysM repeat protein